jgi:hypothetical protein
MMYVALSRIILPGHMHIVPGKVAFTNKKSYGGNAPGVFDLDVVLGYFEGSPFFYEAKATIMRAVERGGACALGAQPVIVDPIDSTIIVETPTGRRHKMRSEQERKRLSEGDDLTLSGPLTDPRTVPTEVLAPV